MTKNGGVFGAESVDGRFLYYSKFEYPGIWRMPLNGGQEIRVLDQPAGEDWWNWGLTRSGIYFIDQPNHLTSRGVKFFDFETEQAISVANPDRVCTNPARVCNGVAVSPDGKSIVFALAEPDESSIMLVKNFR